MSNNNTPKHQQPAAPGKPGEERKPSLNRSIGGKGKAPRPEPSIQPKGLPQGARPAGVESYGSSNWRPPVHKAPRKQVAPEPSPTLYERFPLLLVWKEKLSAQWHKVFPPRQTEQAEEQADAADPKRAERLAKIQAIKASWGERWTATTQAISTKTGAFFARLGTWWQHTWTRMRERLGPPLGRMRDKAGAAASAAGAACAKALGAVFGALGLWSQKGASLAQRTAQKARDKMPELPPAGEIIRKIPGITAGIDAIDAAKNKRAQAATNALIAQTIDLMTQRGVHVASQLQPEPCGNDFIDNAIANGDADTWLNEALQSEQIPPLLYHRRGDALRLIAAKYRLPQAHPSLWDEGFLLPVLTLAFLLHAKRVPHHFLELLTLQMTNLIAIQLEQDPDALQTFLWDTKQAWELSSKEDSSRVARLALSARSQGALSQDTYENIIAGLGQLT